MINNDTENTITRATFKNYVYGGLLILMPQNKDIIYIKCS